MPSFRRLKLRIIAIGKTSYPYISEGVEVYLPRIMRYLPFSYEELPLSKKLGKLPVDKQLEEESKLYFQHIGSDDVVFLFDEKGKMFDSPEFADFFQNKMNSGIKVLTLLIGGAYGFHDSIYKRATGKISLSQMTFSHQMVRLFAVEQVYRAYSIINGEPYHHS
jgi:23S rRNA (pseudouridine1915-N3)-methyltransferase